MKVNIDCRATYKIWKDNFNQRPDHTEMPSLYVNDRNGGSKCFSFIIPYVPNLPILSFFVKLNKNIFPSGKRSITPTFDGSNINAGGLTAFFHL